MPALTVWSGLKQLLWKVARMTLHYSPDPRGKEERMAWQSQSKFSVHCFTQTLAPAGSAGALSLIGVKVLNGLNNILTSGVLNFA